MVFTAQMTFQILLSSRDIDPLEVDFFLRFPVNMGLNVSGSPVDFLSPITWNVVKGWSLRRWNISRHNLNPTINQGFHLRMNSGTWTETSKLRQSAGGRSSNPSFRNANGCPRTGRANPNCGSCASYALCDRIECHTLCACSSKRNWARGTWRVSALNWPKSSKRWVPALRSASSSRRVSIHCWKWKF